MASDISKTWPARNFLATAKWLERSAGLKPVFIGGPADDMTAFLRYRTVQGAPLAEVKTLLAGAALFIGNDSGPAHMAAAFGLPVIVLFGASDADVWYPWKTAAEVLRHPDGIAGIAIEQVAAALDRLRVDA